ncbi:MAG: zinc-binding dehydrogenase [Acidimicrobiales bacterium]|jgi:propanol-preferring alcohol dehydrogenase|nr:zinc-binding dehydrogenase [Acidimicrobiales bacterium]MDP6650444.1 zinc-binding dehydrogenase [Acidimicrobiales bacterium]MDP6759595.1 zinc-binding dehydrogenase [Acidimicrobiales bacterium]|tara:strand:+ start:6301 stop:7326 length:1026 start_codon:yes stop_codon:yes gene_type:complete
MRALVYEGPGRIALGDVDEPVPATGEVLLTVEAAGVCGTDRHIVAGDLGVPPGTVPGHEIAGTILEVDSEVEGWKPGDRVAALGQATCGTCPPCLEGRSNRCHRPQILGMARQGGFAERIALPASCLICLPDGVTDAVGAIASDAIATPYHALTTVGRLQAGETVVVIGAGGLGLHAIQLARLADAARIVAVDQSEAARDAALEAGADEALDPTVDEEPARALRRAARGATLVLECVGRSETVELGLGALAPGGRLVVVGVGTDRPRLPPLGMFIGAELSVHGSFGSTTDEIRTVLDLIVSGRLDVSRSVRRQVPITEAADVLTEPLGPGRTVVIPKEQIP